MKRVHTGLLRLLGGVCGCLFAVAQVHASTIGLTLSSDKDPATVSNGELITFTVGMDPLSAITGYTLDIRYDTTELDFLSSAQLLSFFSGTVFPYTLNPETTPGDVGSSGLATSNSGRASLLSTFDSDPVGNLFSLTFTVLTPIGDGLSDLTVGILDQSADDINPPTAGSAFTITPDTVSASVGVVPVPAAGILLLSGIGFFMLISRRRVAV